MALKIIYGTPVVSGDKLICTHGLYALPSNYNPGGSKDAFPS
jgi:hypothetical protein